MAATVEVSVYHGAAPGSPTDVTSTTVRFKRADLDTQDALTPIPVPEAGYAYSWRKSFKLRAPAVGPDNSIEDLRFYSEGQDLGTDRTILIAVAAGYTQGSAADEGTPISAVDVDTYTTSAPLTVQAGEVFGPAETGDGDQDFVVLQACVGPTAGAGNVDEAKGLVYRWDEA